MGLAQSSTSAITHSERAAKCPTRERVNCPTAVHAEMVIADLHLTHAKGTGRTGAAALEP